MKYKEKTKGNPVKRGHGNNLTKGAFGGKPEVKQINLRIIPKSKREVKI